MKKEMIKPQWFLMSGQVSIDSEITEFKLPEGMGIDLQKGNPVFLSDIALAEYKQALKHLEDDENEGS